MSNLSETIRILDQLVRFDTTSRNSNMGLVEWIEEYLAPLDAWMLRIPNSTGEKSNLWVRIGPDTPGGLVFSGHTDVVPVDDQDWESDPFRVVERGDRLFGRGTSDMKGFVALCLAFAPVFAKANLRAPIHFAFSYDEEVGCQGAPAMIEKMVELGARPEAVWVGEPSNWKVVSGHKGLMICETVVTGKEAHSSQPHGGVSAIGEAIDLMAVLRKIERDLAKQEDASSLFDPSYPTLSIGKLEGGTATNILARSCKFSFDLRCPPGFHPRQVLEPFLRAVEQKDHELRARFPECGVRFETLTDVPFLAPQDNSPAETLLRHLTGDNSKRAAAYTTEAGQFFAAGLASVICGPGSIDQAHTPNEYIETSELAEGVDIFNRLIQRLAS